MPHPGESLGYAVQYGQILSTTDTLYTPKISQDSRTDSTHTTQGPLGTIDPKIQLKPPSFKYEAWNPCFNGPQMDFSSSLGVRETQRLPLSETPESNFSTSFKLVSNESVMAHPQPIFRHRRPDMSTLEDRGPRFPPMSAICEQEPKSSNESAKSPQKVPLHIQPAPSGAVTTQPSTNPVIPSSIVKLARIPYAKLIYWALCGARDHSMTLREIYKWFEEHTDKAKDPRDKGWQNSVRHNLSMNGDFLKKPHPDVREGTKNSFIWVLAESALERGIESTTRYRPKRDDPYRVRKPSGHSSRRQRKPPNSKPDSPLSPNAQPLPVLRNSVPTFERSGPLRFSLPSTQFAVTPATSSDHRHHNHHEHQRFPLHAQHYFPNHTNPMPYSMTRHFEPSFTNFPELTGFESQPFLLARV